MKKSIYNLLILLVFSAAMSQGIAQSYNGKLNLSNSELDGISSDIILVSNRFNALNDKLLNFPYAHSLVVTDRFKENLTSVIINPNSLTSSLSIYSNKNLKNTEMKTSFFNSDWHNDNRRKIYSGLWTFASLNYIYADLIQFMDKNEHLKYHTGTVNGWELSPGFLAGSAAFMQVAIANVFLPHIFKNERTLRWIQIASGTVMTLVQSATLFAGKPTPYYAVLSGFEIAATAYITFDAIKWKPQRVNKKN